MAQGYSAAFARLYNVQWASFANQVAPVIHDYYVTAHADSGKKLLDLCCGTGQLAAYFLGQGWRVTGVDLSEHMLDHARKNNHDHVRARWAEFIQGDAANFTLPDQVDLCVSTYDALNHLPDSAALQSCFRCVHAVLKDGGMFIFDLNTRAGIHRWNSINVIEADTYTLIARGIYDGGERAYMRMSGFILDDDGRYTGFNETAYNTVWAMADVIAWLKDAGFEQAHVAASMRELGNAADDPEALDRAWIWAKKP